MGLKRIVTILFITVEFLFISSYCGAILLKIPFGTVTSIKGSPSINKRRVRIRQRIYVGDRIVTDLNSSLQIRTKKGDIFVVSPGSEVIIKDRENVHLRRGSFRSIIHKLKPDEAFKVTTAGGVAGVKGTEFIVYSPGKATAVFTRRGVVSLSNQGESSLTRAHEMSQSGEGIAPLYPVNFEKDATLKKLFKILASFTDLSLNIPPQMKKLKELPDIIARWNLNYVNYLIDKGRFEEAMKALQIAYLFATIRDVKAEAMVQRAIIASKFLDNYNEAARELDMVIDRFKDTKFYETALYQRGFIDFVRKNYRSSREFFERYKREFPSGKFISNINLLLKKMQ